MASQFYITRLTEILDKNATSKNPLDRYATLTGVSRVLYRATDRFLNKAEAARKRLASMFEDSNLAAPLVGDASSKSALEIADEIIAALQKRQAQANSDLRQIQVNRELLSAGNLLLRRVNTGFEVTGLMVESYSQEDYRQASDAAAPSTHRRLRRQSAEP